MARRLFTCALAALLGSAPAPAPRADDAAPAKPSFGEEVEVVGRRPRAAAADPTASATVVEAGRFEGEAKSVAELVATAPGVAVHQFGGLGQAATISLRGSTADQVQVFLDGLPLNTGGGGGVDLSRIPRAWIQRIEVVRGAEGAVYGLGALGGAVNIVTRPAVAGAWSVETSGGSFRTFEGSADGAIGGAGWGLLGALATEGSDGRFDYVFDPTRNSPAPVLLTREHDGALALGGLVKGWARVGDGVLDAVFQASGGHRDLPGTPPNFTPSDGQRDARLGLVARLAQPIGTDLELRLSASARDDHLTVWLAQFPDARQRDVQANLAAEAVWSTGSHALALRAAGTAERLEVDGAASRSRRGLALTVSDDFLPFGGRLHLTPALRWDALGAFHGASAKLGASYLLAGPLSVRASAGRAFRPPSFSELYLSQGFLSANPALVPETSWSGDLGLVATGRHGLAAATGFAQVYEDLIVYEQDSFRRFKPFNDAKAQVRGVELELASTPLGPAGLTASGSYTLLLSETLRGPASVLGKDLPHRGRHRLFARLAGSVRRIDAHVEAHYVSQAYQDLANSAGPRIPAALTFNAGASVRLRGRPEARLALEVRNLADDRAVQDGFGNPLPGRMVMLTLRLAAEKDAP